mmetsp:Transcript_10870/g.14956  ORF Transcript_10870/g.14956 Transcript_10870/m.14956 type:complete len:538 (-) Transcript_10870:240-1853(-)
MFLGNLSTANEHIARKKSGKKKKDNSTADELDIHLRRNRVRGKPILYTAELGTVPRDVLLDYLHTCSKMMLEEANIDEIVADSFDKKTGLQNAAIDFQRDVLENNYQVERNFGCHYLSQMQTKHGEDTELIDAGKGFMYTAMKSYLLALKARKDKYFKTLSQVPLNRIQILEFFEGCNAKMVMVETKEELKSVFRSTGKLPNEIIVEMQHGILSLLGYDPKFAVSCLNKIGEDFPNDKELLMKMQYFAMCAQVACKESTLSDKEREEFYAPIPPMMHHFPHIFVMQQEMRRQQMMMQQQQQMHASGGAPTDEATQRNRMQEIEALKQSGLLSLMNSPEGRGQIQQLAQRVQDSKQRLEEEVTSWSGEKRMQFFNDFADGHPVLNTLRDAGTDPLAKIQSFIGMGEGELDDMMRLLLVISKDAEGVLLNKVRGNVNSEGGNNTNDSSNNSGGSSDSQSNNSILNGIFTTMGSLSTLNRFPRPGAAGMPMGPMSNMPMPRHMMGGPPHSHGGHECSMHHGPQRPFQPDVSAGKADSMDR